MTYVQPLYPFVACLTLVALVLQWRRAARPKPWLLTVAIVMQWLLSMPVVSGFGSWTLERRYAARAIPDEDAEVIVVLSGTAYGPRAERPEVILASDTYVRSRRAAWLHKNWKPLPVLACGGPTASTPDSINLSEVVRDALVEQGVPAEMIWCEDRSSSTYENALFAAELLREKGIKRIALVTEAFHMPRAESCFRKQGFEVVPAPCGFRTGYSIDVGSFLPGVTPIRRNEQTLHEWIAIVWYWMKGRI